MDIMFLKLFVGIKFIKINKKYIFLISSHGIGELLHQTPIVKHYYDEYEDDDEEDEIIMKPGMVFTIEPIFFMT